MDRISLIMDWKTAWAPRETGPPNVLTLGDMETRLTKNKPAYFLSDGSPYSCKRSFLSALVRVGLWLKILGVFSAHFANSSEPEQRRGTAGDRKCSFIDFASKAGGFRKPLKRADILSRGGVLHEYDRYHRKKRKNVSS